MASAAALCFTGWDAVPPIAIGASVTVVATAWARWLLRGGEAPWSKLVRSLSVFPAAMLAGVGAVAIARPTSIVSAMIDAAVFGSVFWIPVALAVHFVFGRILETAVDAARRGIDAEERAHARVAAIAAAVAGLTWFARDLAHHGADAIAGFAILSLAWSVAVLMLVFWRAWDRVDFLRKLEAGPANGYRVEATPKGAVVKVDSIEADDYRAAAEEDGLLELDRDGRFVRRL
jgi:hypothetical protein